jgi:hypothetical protein
VYAVLATIVSGEADWADVFFLCAVILALVATVATLARSSIEAALLPAAVACIALGFLVL